MLWVPEMEISDTDMGTFVVSREGKDRRSTVENNLNCTVTKVTKAGTSLGLWSLRKYRLFLAQILYIKSETTN